MTWQPQPGTIQHRAVAWLRSMARVSPGRKTSTVELCDAIDADTEGFSAYMATARRYGLVKAEHQPGTKVLLWSVGNGSPMDVREPCERDEPLHEAQPVQALPATFFPPIRQAPALRALEWEGKLLVTGMEIRDGVAIFEPEQVMALKQKTDWWRAQ